MITLEERAIAAASALFGLTEPSASVKELAAYTNILRALEDLQEFLEMREFEDMIDAAGLKDMSCHWPYCTCERECPEEGV